MISMERFVKAVNNPKKLNSAGKAFKNGLNNQYKEQKKNYQEMRIKNSKLYEKYLKNSA